MEQVYLQHIKDALEIDDRELSLSDRFRDYPEWDSLTLLSMISVIDDEYGIVIDGSTFKTLHTLEDVLNEIKRRS